MAKFFVGQRVRIVYSIGWPELRGKEGHVVGRELIDTGVHAGMEGYSVAPDVWGSTRAPVLGAHGCTDFCACADQLQPILPSGAAPSEYSLTELLDECRSGRVEA